MMWRIVCPTISFMVMYQRPSARRPKLVDGDDRRMLELRHDLGFVHEPPNHPRVMGEVLAEDLHGDDAVERLIEHAPDLAGAAPPDAADVLVSPHRRTGGQDPDLPVVAGADGADVPVAQAVLVGDPGGLRMLGGGEAQSGAPPNEPSEPSRSPPPRWCRSAMRP